MELLIVFACYYFVYISGKEIFDVPFSDWKAETYLALVVMIVIAVYGTLRLIKILKQKKQEDAAVVEKQEQQKKELQARQQRAYLYDSEEYEDEIARADAAAAEAAEKADSDDAFLDSLFEKQARELALEGNDPSAQEDASVGENGADGGSDSVGAEDDTPEDDK